jgi:hypothetical protein
MTQVVDHLPSKGGPEVKPQYQGGGERERERWLMCSFFELGQDCNWLLANRTRQK